MKCIKCGNTASFEIRRHRSAFCPEHLLEHLQNQVKRSVKKYKMFEYDDRVLVAVSGGKDSLALWDMLSELGYYAEGIYIDLGIDAYSKTSYEKAENFAGERNLKIKVISLEKLYNVGIKYISQKTQKSFCSVCGLIKRYIMNLAAVKGCFDVIATGHNLDDEAAVLLGNTLRWQTGYLQRQSPNMPASDGLACKVKPLFRLGERETAAYCIIKSIDYIKEECPMSKGASTFVYKNTLNYLEAESPGTKDQFYLDFLRHGQPYFQAERERPELKGCVNCGQPTTTVKCSFCRQMERVDLDPLKVHEEMDNW